MTASREGHVDLVSALVKLGANVDHVDIHGLSAIWRAAWKGRKEVVNILLTVARATASRRPGDLCSILHAAAINNHVELLRYLLQSGVVDMNMRDAQGKTCLYVAASKGHAEIVQLLLQAGADPSIKSVGGLHAADAAARKNDDACIRLFEVTVGWGA